MKSAGNGGVVQSCLQMLHVHVFLAAQLGARRVAKSGADQHQGGVPVRECPHHTGAAADLTVQPLDHVVGTDAGPMLAGKIAVGQRFLCTIFSDIVCCLLSEWCVVTSFYQSLQAMSSFMRFSICASYFTLSRWLTIPKFSFQHCFYHQLLEFWCVFLVWHSFWHNKTPHLLGCISYCLTCGVQFRSSGSFSNLQISYSVRTRLSNFGTRMRMVTLSSTTSLICASQVALIRR